MKTTIDKYKKLKDMDLINATRYDINDRVSIIIYEVQEYLKECEDRARQMLGYDEADKPSLQKKTKLV